MGHVKFRVLVGKTEDFSKLRLFLKKCFHPVNFDYEIFSDFLGIFYLSTFNSYSKSNNQKNPVFFSPLT